MGGSRHGGAGAFPVEPQWRGLGTPTQDNVAIPAAAHRVLTAARARSADEIEAVMASGG